MCLSQSLLQEVEEFCEQITNEEENSELEFAVESLKRLLEEDADGKTSLSNEEIAYAVQCRVEEIWDLISKREKKENSFLEDYYDELLRRVESISDYEADEPSEDYDSDDEIYGQDSEDDDQW